MGNDYGERNSAECIVHSPPPLFWIVIVMMLDLARLEVNRRLQNRWGIKKNCATRSVVPNSKREGGGYYFLLFLRAQAKFVY